MRRFLPLLVLILLLGGGVYFLVTRLLSPPQTRACRKIAELCGDEGGSATLKRCEEVFDNLSRNASPESLDRAMQCVQDSSSCAKAVGCVVGAGGSALGEFFKGLSEGLLSK